MSRGRDFDEITAAELPRCRSSTEPALSLLIFEQDASWVFRLPEEGRVLVGRGSDCGLRLHDRGVSSHHAELTIAHGRVTIRDLESKNGTRINGRCVEEVYALAPGDLLTIASVTISFYEGPAPSARRPVDWQEFRRRAEDELDRATRYKRNVTVACFALADGPAADRSAIDAALIRAARSMDVVSFGAEGEIYLLLPELPAADAFAVVGRITEALSALARVAHVGFATYPTDGYDVEALLAQAKSRQLVSPGESSAATRRPFRIFEIDGVSVIVADASMLRVYSMVGHLAPSALPVLVHGETGTGKELVAQAIHQWSPRRQGPFVAVNCAALADNLVDSELFGHERGAFTGAVDARPGVFERADGGTVFLDEIAELPMPAQAKLLRVLETLRVIRVGASRDLELDFRIVTATNVDLERRVADGEFRRDLYYRLSGATIRLAPLRERKSELPILAQVFLDAGCRGIGREGMTLSADALALLERYAWPGNLRELKNAMAYLASTVRVEVLEPAHIERRLGPPGSPQEPEPTRAPEPTSASPRFRPLYEELEELERRRMEAALAQTQGNQTRAAELLAIPLRTFQTKVRQYGLGKRQPKQRTPLSPGAGSRRNDGGENGDT
jgi:two-component system, NtrC family, response regulator AtoC